MNNEITTQLQLRLSMVLLRYGWLRACESTLCTSMGFLCLDLTRSAVSVLHHNTTTSNFMQIQEIFMAKGNISKTRGQKRDDLERKRDERSRRKVLKKEREIKEYLENDENFVSFKNQLEAIGMKIKDILGDGNCLFRALGDQLNGDHTSHAYHRKNTVQYMKTHRDEFEPFMEDGTTFEKHMAELSKLGTYGGNDSIVAFARNNGVDIIIHQLNNPRWVIHGSECAKTGQKIELHLAYHNGEHYSSVRRLTDPDDGPAWHYNQNQSLPQSPGNPKENNSKVKKKKERKKNPGKSNPNFGVDGKTAENEIINEACKIVMENTGCQDLGLLEQTLQSNNYDIDASIMEILQVMCVLEDEDSDGAKGGDVITGNKAVTIENGAAYQPKDEKLCIQRNKEEMNKAYAEINSSVNCYCGWQLHDNTHMCTETKESNHELIRKELVEFVGNLKESSCNQETDRREKLHSGARPKENISKKSRNKIPHLTNRQRKEQARQEKKKHREERRVDDKKQHTECQTEGENNIKMIVADLGAVSI